MKEKTRERRQGHLTSGIDYLCSDITPIRSSLKTFLASSKTKGSLTEYLATKIIDHFKTTEKLIIVATQNSVECSDDSHPISHLETSQQEADTILFLHAIDAASVGATVHILSPDTDVYIIALKYQPILGELAAVITGQGNNREAVHLKPIYDAIGSEIAAAFHFFTGCETVGRFARKGKPSCWKALVSASSETKNKFVNGFSGLGVEENPTENTFASLEHFVSYLFAPKAEVKEVGKARWLLFRQFQAEGKKLPPTKAALKQHTNRANFQAMIWNTAHMPFLYMPSPVGHGWIDEKGTMVPLTTLQNPAPDAVLELVQYSCAKSKCSANCSCRRNNLVCTEMCKCGADDDQCENTRVSHLVDSYSDDDQSDSDED